MSVVTVIGPALAEAGTVAVICVEESTTKLALPPLNFTVRVISKPVPVKVTVDPTEPLTGEKLPIDGGKMPIVKLPELLACPAAVVTDMDPLVAPEGTVAVI